MPQVGNCVVQFPAFQTHGSADVETAMEASPIYEVPPGAMQRADVNRTERPDQSRANALTQRKLPTPAGLNGAIVPPRDSEYVVFVDQQPSAVKTSTPPRSARIRAEGRNSPGGVERQLIVKEGTGGHPSPILRHKSSLRSAQNPRRHSSASVTDHSNSKPVLRWADSPSIIEIPNNQSYNAMEEERHQSEGDYDDLNVGSQSEGSQSTPPVLQRISEDRTDARDASKHCTAIRSLLRNFNADTLRTTGDLDAVKVLLERIHWYIEDCSNRLLRFIRPRWKAAENLALTIPSLYDACNLYHSMSQIFTTFVYVCLEKATACEDKRFAKKLLKHLNPLEKHRQVYGNAILCLDNLQWQPSEIERLAQSPVTDYFGDIIASLRDINIEERSLYTALLSNLDELFPNKGPGGDISALNQSLLRVSLEGDPGKSHNGQALRLDNSLPPQRMPLQKPPIVPLMGASPPARFGPQGSPTSPIRPLQTFARDSNSLPPHFEPSRVSTFESHSISPVFTSNSSSHTSQNRRYSSLSLEEASRSISPLRLFDPNLSNSSSTPPPAIYSPPHSLSPRGSAGSITASFDSHSNGLGNQDLRVQVAKVESHVEVVLSASENFFHCISNGQPPNAFVQHSKFIVISGQKLLSLADRMGNNASTSDSGRRVLVLTNQLCEQLKAVVTSTKEAAMRFPSPEAIHEMVNGVRAVCDIAKKLRVEVGILARI